MPQPPPDRSAALCPSCAFLADRGFSPSLLEKASALADRNDTSAAAELIARGAITTDAYYRSLADHLGVAFHEPDQIASVMTHGSGPHRVPDMNAPLLWCCLADGGVKAITAPDPRSVATLETIVRRGRNIDRMGLTTPQALRALLSRQYRGPLLENAISMLAYAKPSMSAHFGAHFWQGVAAAIVGVSLVAAFLMRPGLAAVGLHMVMSLFFLSCVVLRLIAAIDYRSMPRKPLRAMRSRERPHYSVLVCLYREVAVVPDLIASLSRINWPRSKLQILLICEEDDHKTLAALGRQNLPPFFEIVRVPPALPRTKPKALNYALAFARGSLLTVYDAEDRPHPDQLEEAWQTFLESDERLACLQAPLVKANPDRNALTALFHLEYAGSFKGLMPWLDRASCPMMLGGTSNHFRRAVLDEVGGWDPFNVTEDADLGLRLWRSGYRTAMLTRPTLEDAPHTLGAWLPQRTRWFKGWMQTWTVHTREPGELWRNMRPKAFFVTQLLLTGTILSALLHPLVLMNAIGLTVWLVLHSPEDIYLNWLAWLDWGMIIVSYIAFGALCWQATSPRQRKIVGWRIMLIPVYWLAQSVAAWRAVLHLSIRPFDWEKTPHSPHQNRR